MSRPAEPPPAVAVYELLTNDDDGRVCRDIPESAARVGALGGRVEPASPDDGGRAGRGGAFSLPAKSVGAIVLAIFAVMCLAGACLAHGLDEVQARD